MEGPTDAHLYDVFEDDSPGDSVPGVLCEACERRADEFRIAYLERKDGIKAFPRTGKWIRRANLDHEVDPENLARDLWALARRHADTNGGCIYRVSFFGHDSDRLESVCFPVSSQEETAEREVRESELVRALSTLSQAYKEQAAMYLAALEACNKLVEKQGTAMGYLADVKMVEEHYRNKREEREADLLEATEAARADQRKWEALASVGIAVGSKLGDTLSQKMSDLWTSRDAGEAVVTTMFRRLWTRFDRKADLLRLLNPDQRKAWEAMATASTELEWGVLANAFRREAEKDKTTLADVVALIVATASEDLPGWSTLAKRAGWITDSTAAD